MEFKDYLLAKRKIAKQYAEKADSYHALLMRVEQCGDFPRGQPAWSVVEGYLRKCNFTAAQIKSASTQYANWVKLHYPKGID